MTEGTDTSLIDRSKVQFALITMYRWIFVPLTLGLAVVMGIMGALYYKTGSEFWKQTAEFWMKIFGINFAVGVATGLTLKLEFGTSQSSYSQFVGDIFGMSFAIGGILALFMEAMFIAVMFFGWDKISKGSHLTSTWLTGLGATTFVQWILVANAWMQHPAGMKFNPSIARNEMVDFTAVAFSPVAANKFCHTMLSSWVLGVVFVIGISCWLLLKGRDKEFAIASIEIDAIFGLVASVLTVWTGDGSGCAVAQTQPMKLAVVEEYYEGQDGVGLVAVGVPNPDRKTYGDGQSPFLFHTEIPKMLSFLVECKANAFVPGIKNIIEGGYKLKDDTKALSAVEKVERGKKTITALDTYRVAKKSSDKTAMQQASTMLKENAAYLSYGYIKDMGQLAPSMPLDLYAPRVMVTLGGYFILFFIAILFLVYKKDLSQTRWM